MTTHNSMPAFPRFHAIVNATPGQNGFGPPGYLDTSPYATNPGRDPTKKRRRYSEGPESASDGVERRVQADNRGVTKRATAYNSIPQLLYALRERFQQGPRVEFSGYCEIDDQNVTHKERVQSMTYDIWKTTGYRFTVKDHPRVNNGHKTRFYCSQDNSNKHKLKTTARNAADPKPRLTSTGDVMAKTRFPCKSRLFISSQDSVTPGTRRTITVRLAHHVSHEPYVDSSLMPDMIKTISENFGWGTHPGSQCSSAVGPSLAPNSNGVSAGSLPVAGPSRLHGLTGPVEGTPEEDSSEDDDEDAASENTAFPVRNPDFQIGPAFSPQPPIPYSDEYQQRMRCHLANIREFCDGLEYQLQFNDTRMLEVVEREGRSFLALVEDCLRSEGRLVSVPDQPLPSSAGPIPPPATALLFFGDPAAVHPGPLFSR